MIDSLESAAGETHMALTSPTVEVVRDTETFLALAGEWNRLLERSGSDSPFLRHEWIRIWWECFGTGKQLHILVARNGADVMGIMPLMLSRSRMYGIRVRELGFIYNVHSPRCGVLAAGDQREVCRAFWRYLSSACRSWDVLRLPQLVTGSPALEALREMAQQDGYRTGTWISDESPYLRIDAPWQDYLTTLSSKRRSNVRNRLNRLKRLGRVELRVVTGGTRLVEELQRGLQLEAKGWKGESGTAILCRPDLREFYRRIAAMAAEQGWLRLYFLTVDQQDIAFDYSLLYNNTLYVLKPAYDPVFASYSPYNSLCYLKLEELFERGVQECDFLGAKDAWKLEWTKTVRAHEWLYVFSRRFRSSLLHTVKFGRRRLTGALSQELRGVKQSRTGQRSDNMAAIDRDAQPVLPLPAPEFRPPVFIPAWPVLAPSTLLRRPGTDALPYPLNVPETTGFYVARNAIYHLFRALCPGGETVLVPDYHSGNEVQALRAAGASIRFYPVRRDLQPDFDQLNRISRSGARVLYVIHFIGWPQPVDELADLCSRRRLLMVEDCALSLLGETQGKPLGSFADYSVFCLYKTLPVPNGGLLVQNRNAIEGLKHLRLDRCGLLSVAGRTLELALNALRSRCDAVGRPLAKLKAACGRSLTSLRLNRTPVGDTGFRPGNVNLGMSRISGALIPRFDYACIKKRRRENYDHLRGRLEGRTTFLLRPLEEGVCPLFFPLLVRHKPSAARALLARGVEATEFWNTGDPEVPLDISVQARYLREHVLELPIHQDVSPAQVDYMADQVLSLGLGL